MKRYVGLLFDKDGTLFDFRKTWGVWTHDFIHALAGSQTRADELAEVMRYDMTERVHLPGSVFVAGTVQDWMAEILPLFPEHDATSLIALINAQTQHVVQVPPVPLVPVLDGLRAQGYRLGVATNDGIKPVTRHLEQASVREHFDFVAGYDSGYGSKPEPGMLLAFAEAIGAAPEEIAMVGDSTHDLVAAKAAGMGRIGVLTGMADARDLAPHADVVLDHIGALPDWLQNR